MWGVFKTIGKVAKGVATFVKAGVNSIVGGTKTAVNSIVSGEGPVGLQQNTTTKAITLPLIIVGAVVGFFLLVFMIMSFTKRR